MIDEKEKNSILKQYGKNKKEIIELYFELERQRIKKYRKDSKILLDKFIDGKLDIKNFEHEKLENARFECLECKYIYNPKYGNEKAGVKPGTPFEELPDNWVCPVCGESKDMFEIHH